MITDDTLAAQQDGATVHAVGDRWSVRIAPQPSTLFHGIEGDWSRDRQRYEQDTIVEVYDRKYAGPAFTPLGQFVTSYGARTLIASGEQRSGGLLMQGDVPAWRLSEDEFTMVLGLIVRHGSLALL